VASSIEFRTTKRGKSIMGFIFGEMPPRINRRVEGFAILLIGLACGASSHAADAAGFHWGAVGHNDRASWGSDYPYNKIPLLQQMHLLNATGMSWYRTGCDSTTCAQLIQAAQTAGVSLLGGFALWPDEHSDEQANYQRAYSYALDESSHAQKSIQYFEASDEVDNWVGMKGDGSTRNQYAQDKYIQARGLLRGLIDGAHAGNPSAKVLVDDAGWCHYGFLKALWEDGVRWDITAFHWYSSQGDIEKAGCSATNVAEIHASFGVPVWITEYNSDSAAVNDDRPGAAGWLSAFITQVRQVAGKYNIQAAFVYELLDEPSLSGMEAHLGIFDGNGDPKVQSQAIGKILHPSTKVAPKPPAQLRVN
jgi:hypothetical protein